MPTKPILKHLMLATIVVLSTQAAAQNNAARSVIGDTKKVAYVKSTDSARNTMEAAELVFSAAPRETPEQAEAIYRPVAAFLSETLGRKVVFRHAGNWNVYQTRMQKGNYDLVFDSAHFNGWRTTKMEHNVLLKVPGEHVFVVFTKKEKEKIANVQQLVGRTVCASAPPDLGALILTNQFSNPSRQPLLVNTEGWENVFSAVENGQCMAGVVPLRFLRKHDQAGVAKIIYTAAMSPDDALSAGPRISPADQARIVQALMSPAGIDATSALRETYASGTNLVPAKNHEYARLGELLRNEWGYY